ncbi:MAG: hypothetical protein R3E83_15640 [Burkholderiaceae bacterium]
MRPFIRNFLALSAAAAAAATGTTAATAATYEKDNRPCLAEVCIGDGLEPLNALQWEAAVSPTSGREKTTVGKRKIVRGDLSRASGSFRGEVEPIIAYLVDGRFDGDTLPHLAKVTAACTTHALQGHFKSASGLPTQVDIVLTPGTGPTDRQRWTVVRILRVIPPAATPEEAKAVKAALDERYAKWRLGKRAPGAIGSYVGANNSKGFRFELSEYNSSKEGQRLKEHPACGGAAATGKARLN